MIIKKQELVESIEAYASAKASGNQMLCQMATRQLQVIIGELPDEFGKASPATAGAPVKKKP